MQHANRTAFSGAWPTGGQAIFVALVLLFVVAFFPSFREIGIEWFSNGPYSHGALAIALIGYIVWQERALLAETRSSIGVLALLCALGGGSLWLISSLVHVQLGRFVGLFGLFIGCLWLIYGWRTLVSLWLPIISLALVLPVWNLLQTPLQEMSSDVSQFGLELLDIPVLREGFLFHLPGGSFVVEEACSGLGFLLTSMLLSLFYGDINRLPLSRTAFLFAFAIAFAIFSNWVRILTIMIVGNATQMKHAIVTDHLTFGWIVFAFLMVPFFAVAHLLARNAPELERSALVGRSTRGQTPLNAAVVIALFLVIAYPTGKALLLAREPASGRTSMIEAINHAEITRAGSVDWNPKFAGVDATTFWRAEYGGREFLVTELRYDEQRQGKELIFVENRLYDDQSWQLLGGERLPLPGSGEINLVHIRGGGGTERSIGFWYVASESLITARPLEVKLAELLAYFTGRRSSFLIAIALDHPSRERERAVQAIVEIADEIQHAQNVLL